MINCPLILEHGTADITVTCKYAIKLEAKLSELNKKVDMCYYEGGGHDLTPTTTKLDSFIKRADLLMTNTLNSRTDDFIAGNTICIDCFSKTIIVDWSQKLDFVNLLKWANNY